MPSDQAPQNIVRIEIDGGLDRVFRCQRLRDTFPVPFREVVEGFCLEKFNCHVIAGYQQTDRRKPPSFVA